MPLFDNPPSSDASSAENPWKYLH